MTAFAANSGTPRTANYLTGDAAELSRLGKLLPPLLSVIAGMVDLTGFLTLGNIFERCTDEKLHSVQMSDFVIRPYNLCDRDVYMCGRTQKRLLCRGVSMYTTCMYASATARGVQVT